MLSHLTRKNLILGWFVIVSSALILTIVLRGSLSVLAVIELVALSLIPPAILLMLWRGIDPTTASEVMHGTERRS
jgi:hypothetical protein